MSFNIADPAFVSLRTQFPATIQRLLNAQPGAGPHRVTLLQVTNDFISRGVQITDEMMEFVLTEQTRLDPDGVNRIGVGIRVHITHRVGNQPWYEFIG